MTPTIGYLKRLYRDRPELGMLDRRRDQRAAMGLPEDRYEMWHALAEVHNGKPCTICHTDGFCRGGNYAPPPPDPYYSSM